MGLPLEEQVPEWFIQAFQLARCPSVRSEAERRTLFNKQIVLHRMTTSARVPWPNATFHFAVEEKTCRIVDLARRSLPSLPQSL